MCVQRGRIPKLENLKSCQNGTLAINLSSLNKRNASLLIAYPQPGTWYIIILATCYTYGTPVPCQIEKMSILLNIHTRKCTFSDQSPCGNHGICQEIQKNILHYATCTCFKGYTGWDCTDISSTVSAIPLISAMLLVMSNIFFVPAIYIAVKRKLYAEGLVYLVTMLFSSLYHACDQSDGQFCITKYEIFTHTYRIFQSKKCKKPSKRILLGLLFAITGLLLYSFIETEKNYQYVHSVWHIIMAISLIFLLPPAKSQHTTSLTNTSFNDDSESWNWKESYRIPTFAIIDQENRTIASN
ncbi:transmembrane protein 8B-like isoform X3 [Temnothorax curvispinosus]|uniref:Transmembrane protein 8B-like isoform X3 n=1 Tax=Temnothorax curvispinosus TaxID=300111 RepID=A0A6J1PDF5_9HYME|nr:transmembrane protein 8B-like isoform X3 [Temnothorax curvispinosus]